MKETPAFSRAPPPARVATSNTGVAAAPNGAALPADPFVSLLRSVDRCSKGLDLSCACCNGSPQQLPTAPERRHISGCCCRNDQQQMLRQEMQSTLSLFKMLLQVDALGYKLQHQIMQVFPSPDAVVATDASAIHSLREDLTDKSIISEGQAFLLMFSKYRSLRCLLAVRLWLQQQEQLRDAAAALGRGDFALSAADFQQQLSTCGRSTAQKTFYHMDWPYALPTQDPQQIQRQLVLSGESVASKGKNARAAAAVACPSVAAADRRATSCLFMSIWRRLRAGQIKTAEALAAAKGASWLVHVLRGGEAWLETHGTEDFCLPGAGGLFNPEEIEFLSNASWILRSALWPCGRTVKDLLEESSSCCRKRAALDEYLETALGIETQDTAVTDVSSSSTALFTGADASDLGRQGEGKTQRGLLEYACSLILHSSTENLGSSSFWTNTSEGGMSRRSTNSSNGQFGLCGSHYCMSQEEAGVYGFILGDLETLLTLAENWGDAMFAVCHAMHEELAGTLVQMLRRQQPHGLYRGEVAAVSAAPAAGAAAAAGSLYKAHSLFSHRKHCDMLQPKQQEQCPRTLQQQLGSCWIGSCDVLQLLPRFSAAVTAARGDQADALLHGVKNAMPPATSAAEAATSRATGLPEAAALDRTVAALVSRILQNLSLLSDSLCSSKSGKLRIATEQRDSFRQLQIQLISAYMEMPVAALDGHQTRATNTASTGEVHAANATNNAHEEGSHTLELLQQLQQLVSNGATVCCSKSGDGNFVLNSTGTNPEVQRFAALLLCALREIGQQQSQRQQLLPQRPQHCAVANAVVLQRHSLFSVDSELCDEIIGQYVFDALDSRGPLDYCIARFTQQLSPHRRAVLVGEVLWRRSASWGGASDDRLDAFVAWMCNSFPADVLAIAGRVSELLWECAAELLPALNTAAPFTEAERLQQHVEEKRVLRGVQFLLQMLLSIFGFFYLEYPMRTRAALPLLRLARTPQRSLAAAAAAAQAGPAVGSAAVAFPVTSNNANNADDWLRMDQQHAVCLLGCYCLSLCCYAGFIGMAVEAAAARRSSVHSAAAAALPATAASSAVTASALDDFFEGAEGAETKSRRHCTVAEWLQHALLPGLVVPVIVESLALCKRSSSSCSSSTSDSPFLGENLAGVGIPLQNADGPCDSSSSIEDRNKEDPFACSPELLLAAPLATSLSECLRCLRQEQMQLRTSEYRLPLLPLQQFTALEAFAVLLKGAAAAAASSGSSCRRPDDQSFATAVPRKQQTQRVADALLSIVSENRNFYFPLLQDQQQQHVNRTAAAAELGQQLQVLQMSQRLGALEQQYNAESGAPMSMQCQQEHQERKMLRALQLEEQQLQQQQHELQQRFYMPVWCEGIGLSDVGIEYENSVAATAAILPSVRSRLLADLVLCAAADGHSDQHFLSSSRRALVSALGCNTVLPVVISDEESPELLLLSTFQRAKA